MAYRTRPGETQHQARERIARAKGFGSYREYRGQGSQVRARATEQLAARDPAYRERARQALQAIRTRASARVRTAAGTVLTSTNMARQYAHVHGAHVAAGTDVDVELRAVVRLTGVDRRRRDPRRGRGRETGYRTLTWSSTSTDLAADDEGDRESFTDALEGEVDDALEQLYGGAGASWAWDTLAVTV